MMNEPRDFSELDSGARRAYVLRP